MKKILITGGGGFIGSNFVHYILNKYQNYKVVNLDNLTYAANLENLKTIENNPNYKFIKGDISDRVFVFNLFEKEKFDIVVNFAAESHVDNSILNPEIFVVTNILGTQILLDASKKYKVKRFHQVSTDEVYGDLPLDKLDLFFTEDTPINPSSPYSASKASADMLVQAYFRTYSMPVTISRCSNNYGPYQFMEKLIPNMINKAINNEKLTVYGNGLNVRDWLHVYDHCSAIDLILNNGKIGEIYNVGGHNEKTNLEVVKIIIKELKKSDSLISYVKDRPGHDLRYAIDPSKIQKQLNWRPKYKFEDGIVETINWYLENKV
ncbi:dTDP-glucose 4,6-dehydratase [Romboutsia sedimentorum]|uniref:dTDP-glucose 4,6-dehydratase n=1 Tax=Romboutsia sedimentorum TaxID=1368474 RepID=A0ABT7ECX4_9FIRM|nr:dTDP-glucose 4,6-dehydratase [Romboutsia sedimentorum]MDK2563796.1 dTDP-glucose 4,6-dehydratase [Romboutsia sedimentorum]